MVQVLDAVFGVNAFDGHHRRQHAGVGDLGGIASEQRLDVERPGRRDDEIDEIGGNVHARQLVHDLVDLDDDDPLAELGGLDDRRRILGAETGVEIALSIGGIGHDQRHAGRQIEEIAAVKFKIGVNGPEIQLAGAEQLGDAAGLRPGERKIEFLGDALFEHVEVFGQRQDRLHHVQIVHFGRIDGTQALGQKISLLLIVAFDVDAVERADNRFEQSHGILRPDDLAP